MSYTTAELVRHHLVTIAPVGERVFDQPVVLSGIEPVCFFGGPVEAASLVVKSITSQDLLRSILNLNAQRLSLTSSPIVRGSVVAASDSSLGVIYRENQDYVIDYAAGDLILVAGGALSLGASLTVWYQSFQVYQEGLDYLAAAEQGQLRRLSGGAIADGQTIYVDFAPVRTVYDDDILNQAVNEANGLVEREVDPEGQFGADPALQAAATNRALEIICYTAALRQLSGFNADGRTAEAWLKLAAVFAERSTRLLETFHPPITGPAGPQRG
jgi:hypothetical protein